MDTILWGATGQAIVLRELLESEGHKVVALFDNNPMVQSPFEHLPIYHGPAEFEAWLKSRSAAELQGIAAIAGDKGSDRLEIHRLFKRHGINVPKAIHRTAFVASDATIGEGAQILASSTICSRVSIREGVIVNTSASVDHECIVDRGSHIGPGATLAGCVTVEELAFVGTGAVVLPRLRIGARSLVGAGAVVTKDVPPGAVVVGTPARILRFQEDDAHRAR